MVTQTQTLFTIADVATLAAVSQRTIRRLVDAGEMPPPLRIGKRSIRFDPQAVRQWIADRCPVMGDRKGGS